MAAASPPSDLAVRYTSGRDLSASGRRTEGRMQLVGKVALVTGAQQGIGRAIAVALARAGADVGVNYLDDRGAAERVAGEIRAIGRRACLAPGDVSRATRRGGDGRHRGSRARRARDPRQQRGRLSPRRLPGHDRDRLGPGSRREPEGQLSVRAGRGAAHGRRRARRRDRQPLVGRHARARRSASTTRRARPASWA